MLTALLLAAVGNCAAIPDSDQRAYCRAMESGRSSECRVIASFELRTRCRVEVGEDASLCNTLSDATQRAMCHSKAQRRAG